MHSGTSQARGELAPADVCEAPGIARGVSRTHICLTLIQCGEWSTVLSAKGYGSIEEEGSILAGDGE